MRPSTITMAELGCGRAAAPSIKVKFLSTAVSAQAAHRDKNADRISFRRIFIAGGILSQGSRKASQKSKVKSAPGADGVRHDTDLPPTPVGTEHTSRRETLF